MAFIKFVQIQYYYKFRDEMVQPYDETNETHEVSILNVKFLESTQAILYQSIQDPRS